MILNVKPKLQLKGSISLPASKSYSIRALMVAACGGQSQIKGVSDCDDAKVALSLVKALGAKVSLNGNSVKISAGMGFYDKRKVFSVGESGTSLRFLLPLLALHVAQAKVNGKGTLVGRPNAHLCQSLRACGLKIKGEGSKESVPIVFDGGSIKGGTINIDGSLSSQFISALLIAAPRFSQDTRLVVTGKELVSTDYVVMTLQILKLAGIKVRGQGRRFFIKANQSFKGLRNFHVPSDYGLAAFPMGAAALLPSDVTLRGVFNDRLVQSDGHILSFYKRMGIKFTKTSQGIMVKGPAVLKGGVFSLKTAPDLVPIMAVMALFAKGRTVLKEVHHARAKESDRLGDLRRELLKVGAKVKETADGLIIDPQTQYKKGQTLFAYHDHRLAMAFTVLGLKIGCKVDGIESSHKSYPSFVGDMRRLGAL